MDHNGHADGHGDGDGESRGREAVPMKSPAKGGAGQNRGG